MRGSPLARSRGSWPQPCSAQWDLLPGSRLGRWGRSPQLAPGTGAAEVKGPEAKQWVGCAVQ